MSFEPFARIPNELFRIIINEFGDQPSVIIKLGLSARRLRQRVDAILWSQLTDVENLADGGCRFFNARQRLQILVHENDKNAKNVVKYIVQMSTNLTSVTTKNSFDRELTTHLLDCLGHGGQQLNRVVLSSCVSDTEQAISLLRRNQPYLDTVHIDGAWAKVPAAVSAIGCNQILDHVTISFAGQQLSGRQLQKLFSCLSATEHTRIAKLSLDIADSDMNGRSKFVKKAWSHFGKALQERGVECLTLSGTAFDLLKIKETNRKAFHSITTIRLINNIWSLNHSLQDWLEVFPRLNRLSIKLYTTYSSQNFSAINNDRSGEISLDSALVLCTKSHSLIRSFIPFNTDITVEVQLDRLTDTAFALSISPE